MLQETVRTQITSSSKRKQYNEKSYLCKYFPSRVQPNMNFSLSFDSTSVSVTELLKDNEVRDEELR